MKSIRVISALLILFTVLCFLSGCAGVRLNISGVSPFRNIRDKAVLSVIDGAVTSFAQKNEIDGLSAGVIRGKEAHFASFGSLNEHSQMDIGTMTTMYTGLLLSNFEVNRWLGREERVEDWVDVTVPVPRNNGKPILVWQLACGVSGLGELDNNGKNYVSTGMFLNQIEDAKFSFQGGEQVQLSPMGTALLCETLRQSYNRNANFCNLLSNQVLSKMDLLETTLSGRDALAGYNGCRSNVYDLLKTAAYCGGMLESDESFQLTIEGALTKQWNNGENTLSLSFQMREGDTCLYFKTGVSPDGATYLAFNPELGIGISIASTDSSSDLAPLANELLGAVS